MADIRIAQGRLSEAMHTYEQALQLAREHGTPTLRGTADMYVGMSGVFRERNELAAARQALSSSTELGEHAGLAQNPYRSRVAMARIVAAEGDVDGAVALLDEAERVYAGDYFPNVRPIPASRARLWVVQGRVSEALAWVDEQGLSTKDDLRYMKEFEHITLARVLLAGSDQPRAEAMAFLERLREAAEGGERSGSVIEILVLQALAHQKRGDTAAALVPLGRALALAEPEGYVRMFVDEGPPMAVLLGATAKGEIASTYARELLAAFGDAAHPASARQDLVEPLSQRELDVLRLLASDLNGPAIANELVVSLNTVRSHTKSIYSKLGVNDRRGAVRRAEELDLLSRGRRRP